jgi:hypothetical protein
LQKVLRTTDGARNPAARENGSADVISADLDARPHWVSRLGKVDPVLGHATADGIAAASRLDLWYNETALKIPGTAATARVPGAFGRT